MTSGGSTTDVVGDLKIVGLEPWFADAMRRLARDTDRSLDPFLVRVGPDNALGETRTTCRCRFVRAGPNGVPRVGHLIEMLTDQTIDYCIPRSQINDARDHFLQTGSPAKVLQLQREAKRLFADVANSGEGGELLLYALLEIALGLPQVLCKMPLKTNTNLHYQGVDGVHAEALENGNLAVYWGEAKLYASVNGAIDSAMSSLAPFVLDDGTGPSENDVLLLRDQADTGDEDLTAALRQYFTADTMEASHLEIRGACLVGFSLEDYPQPFEADGEAVRAAVTEQIGRWHGRVGTALSNQQLESIHIEVFFVPFPSVETFRSELRKRLGFR